MPFGVRMTIGTLALLVPCGGGVFGVTALVSDAGPAELVDRYASAVTSNAADAPADGRAPAPGLDADASAGLGGAPAVPGAATPGAGAGTVNVVPGAIPSPAPGAPGTPRLPGLPSFDVEMPLGGTPVDPVTEYEPVDVPPAPPPPMPAVETRTVTETEAIPFETQFVRDESLPRRSQEVRTPGEQGVRTLTYEVTITDGQQTDKRLVSESVTRDPVTRVVAVGHGRRDCGGKGGRHGDDDNDRGSDSDGGSDDEADESGRCDGKSGS